MAGKANAWTFYGKVLPERFPVSWGKPISGRASQPDLGTKFQFRVVIHAGQILVDVVVEEGAADLPSLRNIAADCARMITDMVGFFEGRYFDIDIVSATSKTTDDWAVFGNEIPV